MKQILKINLELLNFVDVMHQLIKEFMSCKMFAYFDENPDYRKE